MAAIVAGDLTVKLAKAGSPGLSAAQADPNASLGGFVSSTVLAAGANTLFDDLTGDENAAGIDIEYRCLFVHNANTANILQSAFVWISTQTAAGATIGIGVDTTAASAATSASAQALTIANESTAPAGVTFTDLVPAGAMSSKAQGLSLGNIPAAGVKAIWVRRTVAQNTIALSGEALAFTVAGDTGSL